MTIKNEEGTLSPGPNPSGSDSSFSYETNAKQVSVHKMAQQVCNAQSLSKAGATSQNS